MFLCRHESYSVPLVLSEQIKATLETPLVFPPFSPLSWCFQLLDVFVLLPHSLFLSYSLCFLFSLSAYQALGLYCKYTYLQCHCLTASVHISPKCPLRLFLSLIHELIFPHSIFGSHPWTTSFRLWLWAIYHVYTSSTYHLSFWQCSGIRVRTHLVSFHFYLRVEIIFFFYFFFSIFT